MKFNFLIITLLFSTLGFTQQMDLNTLETILKKEADTIEGSNGRWQYLYKNKLMITISDQQNNRMRIISPVIEVEKLDKDLLLDCLTANFHSALDVRYAIANDILWVAYIHPLKELTEIQLREAIKQVYNANVTFGTTFSSTSLLYGPDKKNNSKANDSVTDSLKLERF